MAGLTPEQQWAKELRRILKARASETDKGRAAIDVEAKDRAYKAMAGQFDDLSEEKLAVAQSQIAAINLKRFVQRLAVWRAAAGVYLADEAFKALPKAADAAMQLMSGLLVRLDALGPAPAPADAEALMKDFDALRPQLRAAAKASPPSRVAAPAKSGLDIKAALAALKDQGLNKALLHKEIARNDSWGDFDLAAALNPDAKDFEAQAKVLSNILESLARAKQEKEVWDAYAGKLAGLAANAAKERPAPVADKDYDRSRPVDKDADPTQIYKVAILGAGASAAYYIANAALDLNATILIGEKQPWAGERGEDGQVNHPHAQIDAEDYDQLDPDEGLAQRAEFSARLKKVIDRLPNQCNAQVSKIEKNELPVDGASPRVYWKISTSKGTYFAQSVQSAMGAGKHIARGNAGQDMDSYKRSIQSVPPEQRNSDFTIAINGGSAAIDVVTDVLRKYAKAVIHWAPGGRGAQFIPGTDNDISAIPYFEGLKKVLEGLPARIEALEKTAPVEPKAVKERDDELKRLRASLKSLADDIAGLEPAVLQAKKTVKDWSAMARRVHIYPGRGTLKPNTDVDKDLKPYVLEADGKTIKADKAVFAIGQDNEALARLFQDNTTAKPLEVAPTVDINRHFTITKPEQDPAQIRARLGMADLGKPPWGRRGAAVDLLADPAVTDEALDGLGDAAVPIGAQSADGSLEFIGAQGFRELEAKAARLARQAETDAKLIDPAEKTGDPIKLADAQRLAAQSKAASEEAARAVRQMDDSVPSTLGPNVVNNAQLTSARERIAAAENALPFSSDDMPLVTEPDGVSFITANQTVLAAHIANLYPDIVPGLANYLVAQIIVARSADDGPAPQRRAKRKPDEPEHHLQAFQQFHVEWRKRLRYFNDKLGTPPAMLELMSRWESETLDTGGSLAREALKDRIANLELLQSEIEELVVSGALSPANVKRLGEATAWLGTKVKQLAPLVRTATY
jgi:phage shock protein A